MTAATLRSARVGDRLPSSSLGPMRTRRLEASVVVVPGAAGADAYAMALRRHADDFAAWDGRVHLAEADGEPAHRLLVVDRYRQVYAVHDAIDAGGLPSATDLTEWFRFLATACPECGVLDDPLLTGPTP